MSTDLTDEIRTRVESLPTPPGDLDAVRRAGSRIRRRRRAGAAAAVAVTVAVVTAVLWPGADSAPRGERGIEPTGPMDFSSGLRAYADPGNEIHLGGRTFSAGRFGDLDTQGAATPYGVVFYEDGIPKLLQESGEVTTLEPGAERSDFTPTSKVDSSRPWVAYGATIDGKPTVVVHDFRHPGKPVATRVVPAGTVIDGFDGGIVLLRTKSGTTAWEARNGGLSLRLAGPKTRVADFRNGVVLYDGPVPDGPGAQGFQLVPGAIDAQLTFDGSHVLYWSDKLESTDGSAPIVLDRKATWFTFDTDGSVLAAAPAKGGGATVYDCAIPSGHCEDLGHLTTTGGDPMFMGDDM